MDVRHISEEYAEIGAALIATMDELSDLRAGDVSIVYLGSEAKKTSKGKTVFGVCEKVADKYKWGIPCDFTITIFEPNVEGFTEEQLQILIFHELLHIGVTEDGSHYIRPHDLEDFKAIIDRYGTGWSDPRPMPFE